MKIFWAIILIFLILLIGPLYILFFGKLPLSTPWQIAYRGSAHIAPRAEIFHDAIIQVYSARAFNWRGMFAVHTWIAIKNKDEKNYQIYQVVGWNLFYGRAALIKQEGLPDRFWFGNAPRVLLDMRGEIAEKNIPLVIEAIKQYPYKESYTTWPGPNSNTFIAYIARHVPTLKLTLPPTAIGQDYLIGKQRFFAPTPSDTGYQISLYGLLGLTVARNEGIRVNILGLTFGINGKPLALIIPGVGYIPNNDQAAGK